MAIPRRQPHQVGVASTASPKDLPVHLISSSLSSRTIHPPFSKQPPPQSAHTQRQRTTLAACTLAPPQPLNMRWLIALSLLLLVASAVMAQEPKVRRPVGPPTASIPNYIDGMTICSMKAKESCDNSPWCTAVSNADDRRCAPSCDKYPGDIYEGTSDVTALWCWVGLNPSYLTDQWE